MKLLEILELYFIILAMLSLPVLWLLPYPYFYYAGTIGIITGVIASILQTYNKPKKG